MEVIIHIALISASSKKLEDYQKPKPLTPMFVNSDSNYCYHFMQYSYRLTSRILSGNNVTIVYFCGQVVSPVVHSSKNNGSEIKAVITVASLEFVSASLVQILAHAKL